jgi:hypothetical protein
MKWKGFVALEGLVLRLRKKKQDISSVDIPDNGFFVFGYYDVLEIVKVNTWEGFSPGYHTNSSENSRNFSHEILAKLVKPPSADVLEKEYGSLISFDQSNTDVELFTSKPLLTITFLRYTKKQIAESSDFHSLIDVTNREIAKSIIEQTDSDNPVFAVYPTIGFMDAAVVCRSNNYTVISEVISKLRAIPGFLYTSYIIPCVYTGVKDKWESIKDTETRLLLSAALKIGVSSTDFTAKSIETFRSVGASDESIIYETFGSMDVIALPDASVSALLPLFVKIKDTDPRQLPFEDIIAVSDTSILVRIPDTKDNEPVKIEPKQSETPSPVFPGEVMDAETAGDDEHHRLESAFHAMLDEQNTFGDKSLVSLRNIEGLRSMACFYFDITNSPHSFDIRNVMNPGLWALMKIIMRSSNADMRDGKWPRGFTPIKFNQSITAFRDTFTDLMNDYARAERRMFECRWLKHPSTASNSKLILAYQLFFRDVQRFFPSESTYDFLTVSGGVDDVVTDCLFYYDQPDSEGLEHRLIILRLSELSLFNPSDTLFQLFHEYFHFAGERRRDFRNSSILKSLAMYILCSFLEVVSDSDSSHSKAFTDLFNNFKGINTTEQLSIISTKQREVAQALGKDLLSDISKLWENGLKQSPPSSQVYEYWEDAAFNILERTLSELEALIEQFFTKHCDTMYKVAIETKCIYTQGSNENKQELNRRNLKLEESSENTKLYGNVCELYEKSLKNLLSKLKDNNKKTDISSMLSCIGAAYREAYADISSALLLESDTNEYLNSFRARTWWQADIKSMETKLRIGGVLQTLSNTATYNLKPTGDAQFDNLILEPDNGLFNQMKLLAPLITPLVLYLKQCKEHFPQLDEGILAPIRDLYQETQPNENNHVPDIGFFNSNGEESSLSMLLQKWVEAAQEQTSSA